MTDITDFSFYETIIKHKDYEIRELKELVHKLKEHIIKSEGSLPRKLQTPDK